MKPEIIVADNELPPEVIRAITLGRKIEAIKLLRDGTGLGLANAKVLVDRAALRYAQLNPKMPAMTEESSTGRLLAMMLVLAVVFAIYRYAIEV
ncbi:MAG: hypothetical protein IIB76_10930 [Proteobacteria bacterium]|nr:hypothetical protein [Pseudomonadota bacterium]